MWLLALIVIAADANPEDVWANRTEAAAVRVREASSALAATAGEVSRAGRLQQLALLRDQADELARRANLIVEIAAPKPAP